MGWGQTVTHKEAEREVRDWEIYTLERWLAAPSPDYVPQLPKVAELATRLRLRAIDKEHAERRDNNSNR